MLKTFSLICAFAILTYLYSPFSSINNSPIAQTTFGKVIGSTALSRTGKEYYQYLGLPYAQPPVGQKRFERPEPPIPWDGVRKATSFGSTCIQFDMLTNQLSGSENCLFLNIYVPKKKINDDLPVMVFIHGGYFAIGGSSLYGPSYFMDEQVILVTINYRLAALGFLNTGDEVVRGNMGLKDQLMALNWINVNIKSFGGDPNRVTLFGESAGAASVHFHVLSPRSTGLFSKAIVQSGTPLNSWALYPNPRKQSQRFAAKFGCPVYNSKGMVACLKKVDAVTLVNAHRETADPLRDAITQFVPTLETYIDENTFLSEHPRILLKEGRFNKIPMIAGVNSEEGLYFSAGITANQTKMDQANENFSWWISKILKIPKDDGKAKLIRKFYFGNNENIASKAFSSNYTNLFSDHYFMVGLHQHAKLYSNHAPIRLYYYTHKGDFSLGSVLASTEGRFPFAVNVAQGVLSSWFKRTVLNESVPHLGASHIDELLLLFEYIPGYEITKNDLDFKFSSDMVKLWTSFATNEESDILTYNKLKWIPVKSTDAKFTYLQIDTLPKLIQDPFRDRVDFWETLAIPASY